MIIDARKLEEGTALHCDVAIVGAGAVGITLAVALAKRSPRLRILVAEAGSRRYSARAQQQYFGQERLEPSSHADLTQFRRRMLGGSTTIWGGRCLPYTRDDFADRPDLGRPGWPIGYEEVESLYAEALGVLDAGAPEFSAGDALPGAPPEVAPANGHPDLQLDGIERYSLPTNLARKYRDDLRTSSQITVLLNAPCFTLLAQPGAGGASGFRIKTDGKTWDVVARRTVLAVGGLETARLLLWSERMTGLPFGNGHDNVGRYYMTHVVDKSAWIRFTCPLDRVQLDYVRSRDDVWVRRLIQLTEPARRRMGIMNFAMRPVFPTVADPAHGNSILSAVYMARRLLIPEYARIVSELLPDGGCESVRGPRHYAQHVWNMVRGAPELAGFVSRWLRLRTLATRKLPSIFVPSSLGMYPLETIVEQIPDRSSCVRLGTAFDPQGMPRLNVAWKAGPEFDRHLLGIYDAVGKCLVEAGIGTLSLPAARRSEILRHCYPQAGHHLGTARMSSRAPDGVVDGNLEVWDTPNLFVLSSAVFPTASFANPTLTIVALALRLASHLGSELGRAETVVAGDTAARQVAAGRAGVSGKARVPETALLPDTPALRERA